MAIAMPPIKCITKSNHQNLQYQKYLPAKIFKIAIIMDNKKSANKNFLLLLKLDKNELKKSLSKKENCFVVQVKV